jgi:hypothetical protein
MAEQFVPQSCVFIYSDRSPVSRVHLSLTAVPRRRVFPGVNSSFSSLLREVSLIKKLLQA